MKLRCFIFPAIVCITLFSCHGPKKKMQQDGAPKNMGFVLRSCNQDITTIMVGDGFTPLLASRTYAYSNIAASIALQQAAREQLGPLSKLNGLPDMPQPAAGVYYCYELASIKAFATVACKLVYREKLCTELMEKHLSYFRDSMNLDKEVYDRSIEYGKAIGEKVIAWAHQDHYEEMKGKPKYIFSHEASKWKPTPEDYRGALEPYWYTIRSFTGFNADSLMINFDIPFSTEKGSKFYNLAYDVYDIGQKLTEDQKTIALYWDDNPDQMTFQGHVPTTRRRMSPTSHWIAITTQVCKSGKMDMPHTAQCYTLVSMAMYDAFIICWKQKYVTNLVRPVTYIQSNIDRDWSPLIVTPPFPEFSSGHSAISSAAATVLTKILGDHYHFTDSASLDYGMTPRSFNSFNDAVQEISISRVYGGIHYKTGIAVGMKQGKEIGSIVNKLFIKPNP